jgi:hypothetical protein
MQERERTGRLRVFSNLKDYFEERRAYHYRAKDGKISRVREDLMSAARYAVQSIRFAVLPPSRRTMQPGFALGTGADYDPYRESYPGR